MPPGSRNSRHLPRRDEESSPLPHRHDPLRRPQRAKDSFSRDEVEAIFGQLIDRFVPTAEAPDAIDAHPEHVATPSRNSHSNRPRQQPRGDKPNSGHQTSPNVSRPVSSPTTRSAAARGNENTSQSRRTILNQLMEVRILGPPEQKERRVTEDTHVRSSPPRTRSADSRLHDSGFFSDVEESRDTGRPLMHELHSNTNYDPEAEYYGRLSAIDKLKREVKLSRDPRFVRDKDTSRTNIGEGFELEAMLFYEIATRLYSNKDWRWTFYHLLRHKLYDETTCIASIMQKELKGKEHRHRGENIGSACLYCVKHRLPCARLMCDKNGVKRLCIASLPRSEKLRLANEKSVGYYIRCDEERWKP